MAGEKSKRWRHPFGLKTGRAVFMPVLRSTGQRLDLEVDHASFPRSSTLGYHGQLFPALLDPGRFPGGRLLVARPVLRGIGLVPVLNENPPHLGDDLGVGLDADVGRGDDALGGGSVEVGSNISRSRR